MADMSAVDSAAGAEDTPVVDVSAVDSAAGAEDALVVATAATGNGGKSAPVSLEQAHFHISVPVPSSARLARHPTRRSD